MDLAFWKPLSDGVRRMYGLIVEEYVLMVVG